MNQIENGCKERKCPCRMWVNCLSYVDMGKQSLRLRKKEYDFYDWYSHNFRSDTMMPDSLMNG